MGCMTCDVWVSGLRRLPHRVVDQRLAERPDRAGDLVAGGDDGIERRLDPAVGWVERSDTHHVVASSLVVPPYGENRNLSEDWAGDVSNDSGDSVSGKVMGIAALNPSYGGSTHPTSLGFDYADFRTALSTSVLPSDQIAPGTLWLEAMTESNAVSIQP